MERIATSLRDRPVGIFDSGVGGVSVLRELRAQLPLENVVYYGDTAHAPYGTKPPEVVMARVRQVMAELLNRNVKAVVIACNTATSVAAATLRAEMTLPIIGMEPALKPAYQLRHGGQVLVMATPLTLRLPKFAALMARYGEGASPLPCPGLMELVEAGHLNDAEVTAYLTQLFAPYAHTAVDAVVLGCTHCVFEAPAAAHAAPGDCHSGRQCGNHSAIAAGADRSRQPAPAGQSGPCRTADQRRSDPGAARHGTPADASVMEETVL